MRSLHNVSKTNKLIIMLVKTNEVQPQIAIVMGISVMLRMFCQVLEEMSQTICKFLLILFDFLAM